MKIYKSLSTELKQLQKNTNAIKLTKNLAELKFNVDIYYVLNLLKIPTFELEYNKFSEVLNFEGISLQ